MGIPPDDWDWLPQPPTPSTGDQFDRESNASIDPFYDISPHREDNGNNDMSHQRPFLQAVISGDINTTKSMLDEALNSDESIDLSELSTALVTAAARGYLEIVQLLLECGADDERGIMKAISTGQLNSVRTIVDHIGYRPGTLSRAVEKGKYKSIEDIYDFLLTRGAHLNEMGDGYGPPLLNAARAGNSTAFTYLVDKGADLELAFTVAKQQDTEPAEEEETTTKGEQANHFRMLDASRALVLVLKGGNSKQAASLTLRMGASVKDAMIIAAEAGDKEVVRKLVYMDSGALDPACKTAEQAEEWDTAALLREVTEQCENSSCLKIASWKEMLGLRFRFKTQCLKMKSVAENLSSITNEETESITALVSDHRRAFSGAMRVLKQLSLLRRPGSMETALAYLCLARAIVDLLESKTHVSYSTEFRESIFLLLKSMDSAALESLCPQSGMSRHSLIYIQAVKAAWKDAFDQDLSSSPSCDNLQRMQELTAKLIINLNEFIEHGSLEPTHISKEERPTSDSSQPETRPLQSQKSPTRACVSDSDDRPFNWSCWPPPVHSSSSSSIGDPTHRSDFLSEAKSSPDHSVKWPAFKLLERKSRRNDTVRAAILKVVTGHLFVIMMTFVYGKYSCI